MARRLVIAGVIAFGAAAGVLLARSQADESGAVPPPDSLTADGRFTVALGGDAMITRRLSPYTEPRFLDLVHLLRGTDASFVNLETLLHDYEPYPAAASGGTYMRSDPLLARELVWAGVDLVSLANNHAGDYGFEGMRISQRHVTDAGLISAGVGENLAAAREAHFLETQDGRVALVATSSAFTQQSRAGAARGAVRGRPGLNPLRFTTRRAVTRSGLEALREGLREVGEEVTGPGQPLVAFGKLIEGADSPAVRSEPDPRDLMEIIDVVRNADRLADYVIVSVHAHDQGEYLRTFAHAMIDAGADVLVGHGPHVLNGIEIYKGRPIFYSLGNFIFQNETVLRLPQESYDSAGLSAPGAGVADFNAARYANEMDGFPAIPEVWESVVAIPAFDRDRLVSVDLYPITLGFGAAAHARGRPMLADRHLSEKIVADLARLSGPLGTAIEWVPESGIGRVALATTADSPN